MARIESGSPNSKFLTSLILKRPKWTAKLSANHFGSVTYLNPLDGNSEEWVLNEITGNRESRDQSFSAKTLFDISLDYDISDLTKATFGVNNVLNTYPDKHTHSANISDGNFIYSRRVSQFGVRGRYFFTSLSLKI